MKLVVVESWEPSGRGILDVDDAEGELAALPTVNLQRVGVERVANGCCPEVECHG